MNARLISCLAPLALALLVGACSQGNSGDQTTTATATSSVPAGIDRFLLFPNPIQSTSTSYETNSSAYTAAYYRAIDPTNAKDTLTKWKAANGFGSGGQELTAVFRDVKDLGYGRRMTGRINTDGSVAFFVENYDVDVVPGAYSNLNVDAAVSRDQRWHIGINAIEYSAASCDPAADPAACDSNVKFAKFYNFSATTGERQLAVDLDGKGAKAMPGPCISCHGGRGDPLTPADGTGNPRFPFVPSSASNKRGDIEAHLQPFRVDSFFYSTTPGYTRADQESKLKTFNKWVLCTYPLVGAAVVPEDTTDCGTSGRRTATAHEWQGSAAEMIKDWYGGPGMPNSSFSDTYVPSGWSGNASLYTTVVAPYCRTCHLVRGSGAQSDIDFHTLAKFAGYKDRIKTHVFDRGNMPLALLVYEDFWQDTSSVQALANYIDSVTTVGNATDSSGAPRRPGRPIADPGPAKIMVKASTNATLSGSDSLFATSYSWSVVTQASGGDAVITNATSATPTFHATVAGDYVVGLTVTGSGGQTDSKNITVTVNASFPDPSTISFATVRDVLRNITHTDGSSNSRTCVSCHVSSNSPRPPIYYGAIDRDSSGAADSTDETWLYKELVGRVNLTEVAASPLLRKPSGNHHNGLDILNTTTTAGLSNFSKLYFWILNGTPSGGVAANAGADSSNTVTFTGSPGSANISLSGSASLGSISSYQWSIVSGPSGSSLLTPTAVTATLVVQNVGTYVVQLTVSDGTNSSSATRTITVGETPVAASFTPASGSTATLSFTGTPLTAGTTLTSTHTGTPATCGWQILSGTGASLSSSTSCTTTTLTVPATLIGSTVQVRHTVTGVDGTNTSSATNTLTIASAGPNVTAAIAGTNGGTENVTFTNPLDNALAGIPSGTVTLDGSGSSGPGTLTYAWTLLSSPGTATGSYVPAIASASSATTTLTVRRAGTYQVQLSVDNGLGPNTVTRSFTVAVPSTGVAALGNRAPTFTNVKSVLQNAGGCGSCHLYSISPVPFVAVGTNASPAGAAPAFDNAVDSSGFSLYQRITARTNATDPAQSRFLECPSHSCNAGTMPAQAGFQPGDLNDYNLFLNWIIGGAPNN